ncbi:CD3337/EF1877 family mobilome membrane protein [Enterococcus sp. DIV2324]|uniref:CD3337/EF1877 family mobilome membrane protein n=1 Tax=Enterococcus sp. DIV2324 TaxID=2774763 RepID=UPI003F207AFD
MKKRTVIIGLLVCLIVFFGIGVQAAVADGIKIESISDLLSSRYPIENYRSYTVSTSGFLAKVAGDIYVKAIGGMGNLLFEITKLTWEIFDYAVKELYTMNLLDKLNGIIGSLTGNMWENFKENYVGLILIFSILYIGRTFILESPKNAMIQFAKIFLVLIISGIWFPRSNEYMSRMNDYSFLIQAEVISVAGQTDETSALSSVTEKNGQTVVDPKSSNQQATNVIRNELFKQVVYNPFLLLNYRTTDKDKINDFYKDIDNEEIPKDNDGEYLLSKEFAKLDDDTKIKRLEELSEKNKTLTSDSVEYKLIIALISVAGVFLYGIPITVISALNMFLQLLAIVYSYILPVVALISLIPKYNNALLGNLINIAKIFMGKGFIGLLVLLFSLVNLTIDLLIPPSSVVTAILNTLIKGLIYWAAWKYRDKIIKAVVNAITQRNGSNNFNFDMKQFNESMDDFAGGEMTPSLDLAKNIDDMQDLAIDVGLNIATEGMYGAATEMAGDGEIVGDIEDQEIPGQESSDNEVEGEFTEIPDGEMTTVPNDSTESIDSTIDVEDPNVEVPEIGDLGLSVVASAEDGTNETTGEAQYRNQSQAEGSQAASTHTGANPDTGKLIAQQIQVLQNQPINQTYNHQENNQEANIENNMNNYRIEKHTHKNEFQQKLRVLRSA